jgi:hypothetical protein
MSNARDTTALLPDATAARGGGRLEIVAMTAVLAVLTAALWARYGDEAFVATMLSGLMTCF